MLKWKQKIPLYYFFLVALSYKHTERQASSVGGSFETLTLGLTLGNGSGTDFGASQCIPIGPCDCRCRWCWRWRLTLGVSIPLGLIYIRAKENAIFFFDLLPLTHRCIINTQIGNNATNCKWRRFRSSINAPLRFIYTAQSFFMTIFLDRSIIESNRIESDQIEYWHWH